MKLPLFTACGLAALLVLGAAGCNQAGNETSGDGLDAGPPPMPAPETATPAVSATDTTSTLTTPGVTPNP